MTIMVVSRGCPSKAYPLNGLFEYDQAKALAAAGHRVILACTDIRSLRRRRKWGYERFSRDGVEVYIMNIPVGAAPYALQNAARRLALKSLYRHIKQEQGKPDVVHAHFYFQAEAAGALSHAEHIPFAVTEHSSEVNQSVLPENIKQRLGKAYANADRLIAVSPALAERIRESTGRAVVCVPNMVDLSAFRYAPEGRNGTAFHFVSVGNLLWNKGYDILLNAFAAALQKNPRIRLDIVGGGACGPALKRQIAQLGLEEAVTFHGAQPRAEVARLLSGADAFVLASRGETFGLAYIEAMAAGLPVIATKCGGPEGFVTPEAGLLIPAEDTQALTEALEYMAGHAAEYDGQRISAYARDTFSPQRIAAMLGDMYTAMLSEKAAERSGENPS